jgi:hypothetical protein
MTPRDAGPRALRPLLVVLGLYHLALGLFMVVAPGAFFDEVGPFGGRNDHYVRDVSTFYLALGAVLLLAVGRPGWRVPILAYATIQYGLHALNHLADVGEADPSWLGPADLVSLALLTALLAWLLAAAARSGREARR